ncbi:putative aluminum-activated malate transporter [Rosa chinensis]|uniref:Putative aluminum-activated malate transporter n=1 Tax=Rosa chinensis TaxID=74649 RepID=A0A2P6SC23_ROSCH|nr:putative aluminum-activated malate transporter [Rosa chinensis]
MESSSISVGRSIPPGFEELHISDPRFPRQNCMGLSLAIVSLLLFFKEPLKYVSQYSIWAILTVVIIFKLSIGVTWNKGFNRALGTISAGGLALGIAELAVMAGSWQEVVIAVNIFIAG